MPKLRDACPHQHATEASLIGDCDVNVALKQAESRFRVIDCDALQRDDISAHLRMQAQRW